jgi:hypothetical protein
VSRCTRPGRRSGGGGLGLGHRAPMGSHERSESDLGGPIRRGDRACLATMPPAVRWLNAFCTEACVRFSDPVFRFPSPTLLLD